MSTPSNISTDLLLLDCAQDYLENSIKVLSQATRSATIFSHVLDPHIYDNSDVLNAISQLARRSRYSEIRILVRHTKPLIELGHNLVRLSQRLPSKILIRKITTEPSNQNMAFLICDNSMLIYKHDDQNYQGFANYCAPQEIKSLKEAYLPCWEQGAFDMDLRQLNL